MIHRFRVQNFKSIADVDVELSPVTVLVGRSGTGKSSFVQALRFLRDVLSRIRTRSYCNNRGLSCDRQRHRTSPRRLLSNSQLPASKKSFSTNCRLISSAPASRRTMSVWSSVIDAFFTRSVTRQAHRVGWLSRNCFRFRARVRSLSVASRRFPRL